MLLLVIAILGGVLTLATLLVGVAWLAIRSRRGGARPGAWRRLFLWHVALLVVHVVATVPVALGAFGSRMVGTRGDERAYAGPRLAADGTWQKQSRESLAAEAKESDRPPPPAAKNPFAVELKARDGVPLRGFLVPPRAGPPLFTALLVHGLYRGALELETVGSMFRDLGGEVLLLELRRHGGSGGERFTYGRDEQGDVLGAVDFLRARDGARERPLVLFAVSIGTCAAAIAAPKIERLSALILDAPLEDLRSTAERMLESGDGRGGGLPQPIRGLVLGTAALCGSIPFDDVVPVRAIAGLSPEIPVLLIGAGQDGRVPPAAVRAYFTSLPTLPDRKQLWIDAKATHGHVWIQDPGRYRDHLIALLAIAGVPMIE